MNSPATEGRLAGAVAAVLRRLPPDALATLGDRWGWRLESHLGKNAAGRMLFGLAHYRERLIRISAYALDKLQEDALLETLIAHELAHLVLYQRGMGNHNNEGHVNDLVRAWGFEMDRLL